MSSVPILGPEGWLDSPQERLNAIFLHAFAADRSQSNKYFGNVTSIQAIISDTPNDIPNIVSNLTDALRVYIERYFTSVLVNIEDVTRGDVAQATLRLDISVTENNETYVLGATLQRAGDPSTRFTLECLE